MPSPSTRVAAIGAAVWFALAWLVGVTGVLQHARPPMPQALIAALTLALLVLAWGWPPLRGWATTVDLRALVGIHVSRVIPGAAFLVYYGRGELPREFAVPGGWGDIAVGVAAVVVCLVTRPASGAGRGVIAGWNLFGLVDILFVVATATRLGLADPQSMRALLRLPLSLLPTFLVPIVIATHLIIVARLWSRAR